MGLIVNGTEIENVIVIKKDTGTTTELDLFKTSTGIILWEAVKLTEFNYTGLDVNGNMEGQLEFDGSIVAYALGKPKIQLAKTVSPVPTTLEEYVGYYVLLGTTLTLVTSNNQSSLNITAGTTPCYIIVDSVTDADYQTINYDNDNGYNSEYYGGFDFDTRYEDTSKPTSWFIVPSQLVIPDDYKGKPVTKLANHSFYGGSPYESASGSTENRYYQAYNIDSIVFGANLKSIDTGALSWNGLEEYATIPFVIPDGITEISSQAIQMRRGDAKVILPATLNTIGYGAVECNILVWTAPSVENISAGCCNLVRTIQFEDTVQSVGAIFGTGTTSPSTTTLVFKHSVGANISLNISKLKSAKEMTIYSDNEIVNAYDWASVNITATIKPLSEYEES